MEQSVINDFAILKSKEQVQEFYSKMLDILTSALEDMGEGENSTHFDYNDTRIFPMGDYTNDTFIDQTGELEIVIATSNPQIKIANSTLTKNLREAKNKKQKLSISNKGSFDEIITNYANSLVQYFGDSTVILVTNFGLKILCLQEYGFKVLVRFATFDVDDNDAVLSFWDPLNKFSRKVNLFLYNEMMTKKDSETNGNYKKMVRIFKNIRKTILMNKWSSAIDLNKYFVELVIYNVPNLLLEGDNIVNAFYKVLNYLDNCDITEFKSFDGDSAENFYLTRISYNKIKNFVNFATKIAL